ncbi:membrane protease subunit [Leptospira ognonensis]|uniref:Membrane protease subunit n=1 Tax=Leptospira ognonensis TaxID=2484945 RepID=A0A4R9JWP3_9LEPT|nr:membrane protease subunit [Leptospira ognonensis]TGL56420.1 membrane protease subunit [Leptospira ognonensis]
MTPFLKLILIFGLSLLFSNCSLVALFIPSVSVMIAEQEGKAKLAEAESSRRIAVLEAQAKLDSAKMLGEAEVVRAEATARANRILGESLKNNESYLRYLWIQQINAEKEVYYIPTEAGLPVLEAGKRK